MRSVWAFGLAVVGLGLGLTAAARAADGDLDATWGVAGIGAPWTNFRVAAATATGTGAAAFLGADLADPTEMSAHWPNEPGIGQWGGCCGWDFDVPFLERFEAREDTHLAAVVRDDANLRRTDFVVAPYALGSRNRSVLQNRQPELAQ